MFWELLMRAEPFLFRDPLAPAQSCITTDLLARMYWLTGLPVAVGERGFWLNLDSMETLIWVFPSCPAVAFYETCRNVMIPETPAPLGFGGTGVCVHVQVGERFSRQAKWPIFSPRKWTGYVFYSPRLWCAKEVMMIMLKSSSSCLFTVNDSLKSEHRALEWVLLPRRAARSGNRLAGDVLLSQFHFLFEAQAFVKSGTAVDFFFFFLWRIIRS